MTKDVLISISGLQFAGGENSEPVEVITSGSYYKKNGRHYILYDEVAEDTAGTPKNIIKIGDDVILVNFNMPPKPCGHKHGRGCGGGERNGRLQE